MILVNMNARLASERKVVKNNMIYEIENVKKPNILARRLGIDSCRVTIRDELGKRRKINFKGQDMAMLYWDLNRKTRKMDEVRRSIPKPKELVGSKFIFVGENLKWL